MDNYRDEVLELQLLEAEEQEIEAHSISSPFCVGLTITIVTTLTGI
ncbi:MAG: hypothetical protein FWF57_09940 [Defluviitaleaceae bacterium]|nr:hypothetical protein [Defluviitaleaceae bacterium]